MTSAESISTLSPEAQRHTFLTALFHDVPGWLDLRLIREDSVVRKAPIGIRSIEGLLSNGIATGRNCYIGMATRISNSTTRGAGDKKHLHSTRVLWADVDYEQEGDAEALATALESFPFPPSMRVMSGGGEHVYWFLNEPFDLSTEANRTRFECVLKGIADVLSADRAATDSTRILRIPGTTNYPDARKRAKGRTEALAVLLECEPDRVYHIDDFDSFGLRGGALTAKRGPVQHEGKAWDGKLPEQVAELIEQDDLIRRRWNGGDSGLKDTSDSGIDFDFAKRLAVRDVEGPALEAAIRARRAKAVAKRVHDDVYYTLTASRALDWAAKQRNAEPAQKPNGSAKLTVVPAPPLDLKSNNKKPPDALPEDATDAGLASAFIRLHGRDLLHLPTMGDGRWYSWDASRFQRDDGNEVRRRMLETGTSLIRESADAIDKARDELLKMAKLCRSSRGQRSALWIAASDPAVVVRQHELDAHGWLFNCANGTFDLRAGKFREHRREDRLTRVSPVTYDPDATAPRWAKFLEEVQTEAKMRTFLQRAAGYSLASDTTEECMFILYGYGANGKTTLIETLRGLFGSDYAIELPANALTLNKHAEDLDRALAPLPGIRLATTVELREGQRLNEQSVKRITSGEPMRAKLLYRDGFEFVPICTLWTGTNHKPTVSGDDDGIWRRLRLVLFDQRFEGDQVNQHLRAELREELSGIFNWAIEGCLAWQRDGLNPPESVIAATSDYRHSEDQMFLFIDDYTTQGSELWVSASDLRSAITVWHAKNGSGRVPSARALSERLKRRNFVSEKQHDRRGWRGLTLTNEARHAIHGRTQDD